MKKQIIITIGREHGSGGHCIARRVAEELGIKLYDKEVIDETAAYSGYDRETVGRLDEKPVNFLISRRIGEYSNSLEDNVAKKTFSLIRAMADRGDSFVIVGRCAEYILRDNPCAIRVFISGAMEDKILRIMETNGLSREEAEDLIHQTDRRRKAYHNYFCENKWGDSRGYDVTVNSSKFGIDTTVEVLTDLIRTFLED